MRKNHVFIMQRWLVVLQVALSGGLLWQGSLHASELPTADKVLIEKTERKLHLFRNGIAFKTFDISLGLQPVGGKNQEGDFRTPEGKYMLDAKNPNSKYFLSIRVSYPNAQDRQEAQQRGVSPGGAIMIHGQPNVPNWPETYYKTQDWTDGCIAVSNSDMLAIWSMTNENTPIEIRP